MSSTAQTIAGFAELVNGYKMTSGNTKKKIQEAVKQVRAVKPEVYHDKHISRFLQERVKVLDTLLDDYLKVTIGSKYPIIDSSMFALIRHLQFKLENKQAVIIADETSNIDGKYAVSIPLFATVNLHEKALQWLVKFELQDASSNKVKVELSANLPGTLDSNLRKLYRKALAHTYSVLAELFNQDGVGEILAENFEAVKPDVIVAWIPTVGSLNVKTTVVPPPVKLDPAMFIKVRNNYFLIALWAIADEMPLEHFIREYSTGSLQNVKTGHEN